MSTGGDPLPAAIDILARLEKAIRRARPIIEAASANKIFDVDRALRAQPNLFDEVDSLAARASDGALWNEIREELQLRRDGARVNFGALLESELLASKLEWTGTFPKYRLTNGITIEIDPTKGKAVVGRGRKAYALDPKEIVSAAKRQGRRRASATLEPAKFANLLTNAYATARGDASSNVEGYVPIRKVHQALRRSMSRGYTESRFVDDLARMFAEGQRGDMEFAPPRDARQGVRVPWGEGVVVGSLRIKSSHD